DQTGVGGLPSGGLGSSPSLGGFGDTSGYGFNSGLPGVPSLPSDATTLGALPALTALPTTSASLPSLPSFDAFSNALGAPGLPAMPSLSQQAFPTASPGDFGLSATVAPTARTPQSTPFASSANPAAVGVVGSNAAAIQAAQMAAYQNPTYGY